MRTYRMMLYTPSPLLGRLKFSITVASRLQGTSHGQSSAVACIYMAIQNARTSKRVCTLFEAGESIGQKGKQGNRVG